MGCRGQIRLQPILERQADCHAMLLTPRGAVGVSGSTTLSKFPPGAHLLGAVIFRQAENLNHCRGEARQLLQVVQFPESLLCHLAW